VLVPIAQPDAICISGFRATFERRLPNQYFPADWLAIVAGVLGVPVLVLWPSEHRGTKSESDSRVRQGRSFFR
jgi:lambda repressor-like predicted transcriptional regulator